MVDVLYDILDEVLAKGELNDEGIDRCHLRYFGISLRWEYKS